MTSCEGWTSKPWMRSWRMKMKMKMNTEGKDSEEEETTDEEAITDGTTTTTIAVDAVITDGIITIVDAGTENRHRRDRVGCPRGTWMKTDDRRTADSARGVA